MKSIKSAATIENLREMFATHGLPSTLVSDNGSNFTSSEFQEFVKRNGTLSSCLKCFGREGYANL